MNDMIKKISTNRSRNISKRKEKLYIKQKIKSVHF